MPKKKTAQKRKDYSGLKPKKGWVKRNIHFFGKRVFTQVFKRRLGTTSEAVLDPPPTGVARCTLIWC